MKRLQAEQVLPADQGGTGQSIWVMGDILYAIANNTLRRLAIGASNQVLGVSGGLPGWISTSLPPPVVGMVNGDMLYWSTAWQQLSIGSNKKILQSNGSVPLWVDVFGTANIWTALQTFNSGIVSASMKIGDLTILQTGNDWFFMNGAVKMARLNAVDGTFVARGPLVSNNRDGSLT